MKSLLPNNFKNPSAVDKSSSGLNDLGNLGLGLGKKDAAPAGGGFADFLMQSIQQEKHAANPKEPLKSPSMSAPSSPSLGSTPRVADKQVSNRLEQDLVERRNLQLADRTPTALRDRDDSPVKDQGPDRDTSAKLAKSQKPEVDRPERSSPSRDAAGGSSMSAAATKDLRPLKMAVGSKSSAEALAGNNPVLSFVTGRLDRLDPEGIPSIITGNPLLRQVAAAGEISDIMLQPMSISDLCKIFEISESVMNKAITNGLNTEALVAPKDFLTAIGVDAGRVSSELQILQQRLPVDGVHSYVERARAMGQKLLNQNGVNINEGIPVEVVSPLDHASAESLAAQPLPGSRPDEEKPGLRGAENVPVGVPNVPNIAVANAGAPAAAKPAGIAKTDLRSRPQSSPGDLMESLLANRAMGLSTPTIGMSAPKEQSDLGKIVETDSSELDPYAMLGQDMRSFQTDTTTFAPVTVGRSMANLEEQMAANGFSLNQKSLNQTSSEKTSDPVDFLSDRRSEMTEIDVGMDLQSLQESANVHSSTKNLTEGVTLAVEGLTKGSGHQSSFQESMSGGSEEKDSGFSKESLTPSLAGVNAHSASGKTQEFGEVMGSGATAASEKPQQGAGLHNKIMQHASMMLKDGGGSMRMNVDAPGMGKIDLAIHLANNQLDVRILTPNEQVRDIINKELSGLRDGLGQQGISLRAVEVSNASQSSNQFAGGRFGHGHSGQQASYNEMKEYAESFAGSFTPRGSQVERMRIADVRNTLPSSWINTGRENSKISVRI